MSKQESVEIWDSRVDPKNRRAVFALLLKPGFSPEQYASDVQKVISFVRKVEDLLLLQDDPTQALDEVSLGVLIGREVKVYKSIEAFVADFTTNAASLENQICDDYATGRLKAASKIHRLRQERRR